MIVTIPVKIRLEVTNVHVSLVTGWIKETRRIAMISMNAHPIHAVGKVPATTHQAPSNALVYMVLLVDYAQ